MVASRNGLLLLSVCLEAMDLGRFFYLGAFFIHVHKGWGGGVDTLPPENPLKIGPHSHPTFYKIVPIKGVADPL
jgi:hypothetical protein